PFEQAAAWVGGDGEVPRAAPWWQCAEALADVTEEEEAVLRYIERSVAEFDDGVAPADLYGSGPWSMRGLGAAAAMGVEQLSFTSSRYHLAFCGYAAASVLMRCPAYTVRLRRILRQVIEAMLAHRTWGYMGAYWPGPGTQSRPFGCEENVMWTGHLLQLVTMYEALTGDPSYRRPGGIVARDAAGAPADATDTVALAELCARAMRQNVVGGMCCEPGLVFFQCQNHCHLGFRLLEGIVRARGSADGCLGTPDITYSAETERWERFALQNLAAPMRTGAFKVAMVADKSSAGVQIPFGHPGSDGWCLAWYFPWARSAGTPSAIWWSVVQPQLASYGYSFSAGPAPARGCAPSAGSRCGCSAGKGAAARGGRRESPGANDCCLTLDIPPGAWMAQLLPAAAQAGDLDSFARLRASLLRAHGDERRTAHGERELRLRVGPEWSTGSTANFLLGLASAAAPGLLRRLALEGPAPEPWCTPELRAVAPAAVGVFRARVEPNAGGVDVVLGLLVPAGVGTVELRLARAGEVVGVAVARAEGLEVRSTSAEGLPAGEATVVMSLAASAAGGHGRLELRVAVRTASGAGARGLGATLQEA
ncbi:unnamed protein product, partial [Prorocentrum cordatum]